MSFNQHNFSGYPELTPPADATAQPFPFAHVLLLDVEAETTKLAPILRRRYRVVVSSHVATARAFLDRTHVDLIVTDIQLADGGAIDLCRSAKALPSPPGVLVTTEKVEPVPDALEAGCDAILLKPFAPNLLVARMGRLLRERMRAATAKAQYQMERSTGSMQGTNRVWRTAHCPRCEHPGPICFEFSSHRRAWYACLQCKNVWLGKRQE
jgi:CheY-like chemotaxis protein